MQTWKDIKAYILKKESKRRSHIEGTGGGPPCTIVFSNFEEEVLELLTPEAAGLLNIPEGGINSRVSSSLNNPEDNINIEESILNEYERDTEDCQIIESQNEQLHTESNNIEHISSNILKHQKETNISNEKATSETAQKINKQTKNYYKGKLYIKDIIHYFLLFYNNF